MPNRFISSFFLALRILVLISAIAAAALSFANAHLFVYWARMHMGGSYRWIANNVFFISSTVLAADLVFAGFIGIHNQWTLLLLPIHFVANKVAWILLKPWYRAWKYALICQLILDAFYLTQRRSILKKIKKAGVLLVIVYFYIDVLLKQEPFTHYTPSPDFVPLPLCPNYGPIQSFGDHLNAAYIPLHKEMLLRDNGKILVFSTSSDGLGNRIQGMLSAFLMAVLLNRCFLVEWSADKNESNASFDDLFQEHSFPLKIDHLRSSPLLWEKYIKEKRKWIPYCRACALRSKPERNGATDQLLCQKDLGIDPEKSIAVIVSTLWFAPAIARNPHFRAKICAWTGLDLFGTLFKALIRLNEKLLHEVQSYVGKNFANSYVVALHLRKHEGNQISSKMEEVMARCASLIGYSRSSEHEESQVKWFIAADSETTRERIEKIAPKTIPVLFLPFESRARKSRRGVQKALMEIWILGEANQIITSPYSTFGYVAHARTKLVPYTVTRDGKCFKALTSQPCALYWFGMTLSPCFDKYSMLTAEMTNQEDCYL